MTVEHHSPRPALPDVRRIARDSLADAITLLGQHPISDRAVHGVRKDLKRARAMLRLMRTALGDAGYHRANTALRDAARDLSAARDSKVLLDTLRNLPQHGSRSDLQSCLRKDRVLARSRLQAEASSVKHARKALRAVRRELADGPVDRYGWTIVQQGVRRVYTRARTALTQARQQPSPENLHELRKQTKYLWHQLEALVAARPRELRPLAAATHQLSDLLGGDHDLTALRSKALEAPMRSNARRKLLTHIDDRSGQLLDQAMTLAARIYRDPPAVFAARVVRGSARRSVRRPAAISS